MRPAKRVLLVLIAVQVGATVSLLVAIRDYGWIGKLGEDKPTVAIRETPPRVKETVL
jgi:hypothetical protein